MFIEATTEVGSRITSAIQEAARTTGAGFDYLLKTALRESSFDASSKAITSSATGLFQFIDQTWLATVKEAGSQLGYGRYADQIVKTSSGNYVVPDATARNQVMKLRTDPTANAVMAGAFTQRNSTQLSKRLGREPTNGELYIAHVLGSGGAAKLISATTKTPQAKAADLFPGAARANRTIFYDKQGGARSVSQVYDVLSAKMNGTVAITTAQASVSTQVAPALAAIAAAAATTSTGASAKTTVAASAAPASGSTVSGSTVSAYAAQDVPMFQGLFRTDRREAVSPLVSELWTAGSATKTQTSSAVTPAAKSAGTAAAPGALGKPLELFQFLRPEVRASAAGAT